MDEYSYTDEATVSRIADTNPRCMSAYFLCIHNADEEGKCTFTRDEIEQVRVRSWTKFKNDIRTLAFMFILDFSFPEKDRITIELIPQEPV
jgi:hypothetical protein